MTKNSRPTKEQALEAVRTLVKYIGDDPERGELKDTPARVIKSYDEFFSGYGQDLSDLFKKKFKEHENYDGIISLKDIRFESYCEHHFVPITGKVSIAYFPNEEVIGISKLARIVDYFSKRLQLQERLTAQIAKAIDENLKPKGVAIYVEADHQCISTRGIHKVGSLMQTMFFTGCFKEDESLKNQFLKLIDK